MTDTFPTVKWNSRERALSNDMNQQARLVSRAITEAATAIISGTLRKAGCFGLSFLVTPVAASMNCIINPGTALFVDGVSVYPDSTVQWVESSATREVTLDASDANSRYDVVEMRPGTVTVSTQPRDEFNPLTGTFTVTNMVKEVASYPEFQVRKGTPSATPSIPVGTAGWMPLAYVRVVGGAVALVATDVVHCRPVLDAAPANGYADPTLTRFATKVRGGGLAAAGGTLTATLATNVTGRFPGSFHDFRVDANAEAILNTFTVDGGVLPAASCALYFYAAPAPFPPGYSTTFAQRELWTPDVSMLYGANSGFTNAGRQDGCIIVSSENAPSLSSPAGAPSAGGTSSLSHTFFSSAPSSSARANWVYIGAVVYDPGFGVIQAQVASGPRISPIAKPGHDLFPSLPINNVDTPINMWSEIAGDPVSRFPTTARRAEMQIGALIGGPGYLRFAGFDSDTGAVGVPGGHYYVCYSPIVTSTHSYVNVEVHLTATGVFTIRSSQHSGATEAKLYLKNYVDSVLAMR